MTVLAHFEPLEFAHGDRRVAPRWALRLGSSLLPCCSGVTIHDLSLKGLLLETSAELAIGDAIEIELPEVGWTGSVVVWRRQTFYGCQFDAAIPKAVLSAARLRGDPGRPPVAAADWADALETDTPTSPRAGWSLIVAVAVAALAFVALSAGLAGLAILVAGSTLLLALLVGFAVWIQNNTADLSL